MHFVLLFAVVLLAGSLFSEIASRSVLSTSVLFLVAGFVAGPGVLDYVPVQAEHPVVVELIELALFAVLFTDGMRLGARDLRRTWHLPGRALAFGMPIAFIGTAVLAHFMVGMAWLPSLLIGAVLAPTDPVFASALVGNRDVPPRLQRLLNVESGLNDGLALPAVVILLAVLAKQPPDYTRLALQLAAGIVLGLCIPAIALWLESRSFLATYAVYEPLFAFAIAAVVYAVTRVAQANEFLAAFSAGVMVASLSPDVRSQFEQFGETVTELLKLASLLVFGALVNPGFFLEFQTITYVFVALVLVVVRPLSVTIALVGSDLGRREWLAASWFGPKGFASVVYGLFILRSGIPDAERLFHLVAIVVAVSIIAHSSTDVLVARWFRVAAGQDESSSAGETVERT